MRDQHAERQQFAHRDADAAAGVVAAEAVGRQEALDVLPDPRPPGLGAGGSALLIERDEFERGTGRPGPINAPLPTVAVLGAVGLLDDVLVGVWGIAEGDQRLPAGVPKPAGAVRPRCTEPRLVRSVSRPDENPAPDDYGPDGLAAGV